MAGKLGIDRLAYWASSTASAPRPESTCPARSRDRPDQRVEAAGARRADLPGRDLPGRDRPGLRRRHADPADQRLRGARERRKLYQPQLVHDIIGPDGTVVQPFKPNLIRKLDVARASSGRCARRPARRPPPPHLQPRRPADRHRRQVRYRRVRAARQQGSAAVPLVVRRLHARRTRRSTPTTRRDQGARQGRFRARRPRLRLRLTDEGQRCDRDREVLHAAPLRDQEGLPQLRPPEARQLLPVELMRDMTDTNDGAAWA